ncbi:MAG: type II toxin-antitoxin system VapC family toxin [Gemmatimonadaceae bacterium]
MRNVIVVDTNVVAYLLIEGEHTQAARTVFQRDPVWAAPLFWRSELRNVLARYVRQRHLPLSDALVMQQTAEELFAGSEYPVDSTQVLQAAATSGCTAYDCEFVMLAQTLGVSLVTSNQQVLLAFPNVAVAPNAFANGKR